jgi:ketosteroid isomerase-like protein
MLKKDFGGATRRLGEAAGELSHARERGRRANIRAVQAQIDAIARGDLTAALADAHPEVELEIFAPPEFDWVRRAHGVEEMSAAITHNFGSLDQQTPTIQNVLTQADTVVLFGHEHGIIRATGARYDVQFVQRFTFEDGRLRSVKIVVARHEDAPAGRRGSE